MDDIMMIKENKLYRGTVGLWKLLTDPGIISDDEYTSEDRDNYKDILIVSDALYQRNDVTTQRPKSSVGAKWKYLIKPIWDEHRLEQIQVIWSQRLGLMYIQAQAAAGNNNFHNEKMSVVQFINDRMEELVTKPNGLEYVLRCLSAFPEHVMNGSAARHHDIWYSKHKNNEEQWEADKVLQDKAFDRVIAPDADLSERLWSLGTGSAMWAKRKLGMGLGYVHKDLKTTSNRLQAPRYTRLTNLTHNVPYRVMQFERCTTRLGETVMAILEDNEGQYRVFLPDRYLHALTDDDITKYNTKDVDRIVNRDYSAEAQSLITLNSPITEENRRGGSKFPTCDVQRYV
ncbi:hypothetical protein J6590_006571 [Homalodisca vitripennis]|nr:hypothetical protein J6590_006571 [Homalodisca vitripennis]